MTTTHTPGPWYVEVGVLANEGRTFVRSRGNSPWKPFVAETTHAIAATSDRNIYEDAAQANARLIAAAPDLLDLLEAAIARVELANAEGNPILSAWLPDAKAAAARVRGEQA